MRMMALFMISVLVFPGTTLAADQPLAAATPHPRDYRFDGKISRQVLENYLSRSVSFTELLHDDLNQPRNSRGVDPHDNIRFILNTGAKFVGRALMCWGRERELGTLLYNAKLFAAELHKSDPDVVFQGAAFEIVTPGVETIAIPEYVFKDFGRPVETRNFRFDDIGYAAGTHRMGNGKIPDMSRLEARMWFYYLCTQYVDAGIEAIHFGQVGENNAAERALRPAVVIRKISGGHRGASTANASAVITSILRTARQQGRHLIDTVKQLVHCHLAGQPTDLLTSTSG